MKARALSFEGPPSREHLAYIKQQAKDANRRFKLVHNDDLFESMALSQVVYLGDFHTFDQSTRNLERIVKAFIEGKGKFALGMEMVQAVHQEHINQFLGKLISEEEFLESVDYHESWRFPWSHYKSFFELARKYNFPIIGLNTKGPLSMRDQFAASKIVEYLENNQQATMLALFGELHIIPSKLPDMVQKLAKVKLTHTIIHQNMDQIYWKLVRKNPQVAQQGSLVRFGPHEYCLISSPPWIKYESMVYWYDNLNDDPEFDLRDSISQASLKLFTSNIHDNFLFLCQNLAQVTGMLAPKKLRKDAWEGQDDFNLYDYNDLDLILKKVKLIKNVKLRKFFHQLIIEGRVVKIPDSNIYYLSHYSINRLASVAGIHLIHWKNKMDGQEIDLGKLNSYELFKVFFSMESYAHLCSKIINPHRKCDLYLDLKHKSLLKSPSQKISKKAVLLLGKPEHLEKKLAVCLKRLRTKEVFDLARIFGRMAAEILYEKNIATLISTPAQISALLLKSPLSAAYLKKISRKTFETQKFKAGQKRYF